MKRGTEGGTERVVERVMKRLIPTLSIHGAPADSKVNPRTSLDHQIKKSEQVDFQLQFANKLPETIYTMDKIRDASDESVQIKLVDTISRKTIKVGLYSSLEIEILVLDGDFGYEGNENWTEQEFNAKIVCQREGKGPSVKGKQKIMLTDGVGTIQDLSFSDHSSWIKCKKFRLGARVLQNTSNMGQVRIKGAITEAFKVRDHRSKNDHEKLNAYSNPLISPTTGLLLRPFQSPHQGSGEILQNNDSNRVSSSSHVNVQLTLSNDNQYS
ncbi:hypothetical protein Dsin_021600 [Dipteronia sinensis]|uniref:Calmodulin binding protein-like N-terminal domain-containing protein n=1 Tax=Dipteronia sinensis TaxID=43782 RepID=A0AAE0A0G5_9ROSI|nr:hypothetical protein Dsin_021600 [Dipteronia sinensis]